MHIFERAFVIDKQAYRIDTIQPMRVEMAVEETGGFLPYTTDANKEWSLELRIAQTFWANDVQKNDVAKAAMRAMAQELYRDILQELPRLRLCIESGDKVGALDATFRIQKATEPE